MTPNIPLIAWTPDTDPTRPGVITEVDNLVPTLRGYAPDGAESNSTYFPVTMPAGAYHDGAACLYFPGGQIFTYLGAATSIYMLDLGAGSAYDVSPVSVPTGGFSGWQFAAFNQYALAVNGSFPVQVMPPPYTAFADVSGAPNASTVAVQRNFVILGDLLGTASYAHSDGWWCSAQEDHTDWTPDIATQCARGRLTATPGNIVRLIAFRGSVMAFKSFSMYRGDYAGPSGNTWSWPLLSKSVGLVGRNAICDAEDRLYWLAPDGFYTYDGANITRINSAPWNYINEVCGPFTFNNEITAVWDRARRLVRFYMRRNDTFASVGLAYHPETNRWGTFRTNAYCAFPLRYEFVRTPWASGPDQYFFALGTVDRSDLRIKVVSGGVPAGSAFTTGDIGDDDKVIGTFRARARFLSAPTSSTMSHFYRMNLDDALTEGVGAPRLDGKYDVSHSARWHRLKFQQSGMYEVAGFSVGPQNAGTR